MGVKMEYKVTNKLEQPVRFGNIVFGPRETKTLKDKPTSDKFHIEKIEEEREKPKKIKQ